MSNPLLLHKSITNPIPHWIKKVPEKRNTLYEVRDLPAKFFEKFSAIAGCVKEMTIDVIMYKVNKNAPALLPK